MQMQMTEQIARAAAKDAANRQMKREGRTCWSEEDYNLAVETFEQLWGEDGDTYEHSGDI